MKRLHGNSFYAAWWEYRGVWSPTLTSIFAGICTSCRVDGAGFGFHMQCVASHQLFMCVRSSQTHPSAGLLESHPQVSWRAGVPLRVRPVPLRLLACPQRGTQEVSQPLHLFSDPAQLNPERPGSGGLRLRPGPCMQEHQTSHRAVPAAGQQHGLHWGSAAVRDGPVLQGCYEGLFISLPKTVRRRKVLG